MQFVERLSLHSIDATKQTIAQLIPNLFVERCAVALALLALPSGAAKHVVHQHRIYLNEKEVRERNVQVVVAVVRRVEDALVI